MTRATGLRGLDVCIGSAASDSEAARDRRVSDRAMKMASIKQVPVVIAQAMLAAGQAVISQAKNLANSHVDPLTGVILPLPGGTARDKVVGKLQWHADTLKAYAPTPNAIYPSGDDLKTQVLQAYTEYDAVLEGLDTLDHAWGAMWDEIEKRLAALPQAVLAVAKEAAWYTKAVFWVALGGAVLVLGLVGWGVGSGIKNRISRT